jgi:hypothetical protein
MSRPKLANVDWMTVSLIPVTTCHPPEGETCYLQRPSTGPTAADAKRHALEHPHHQVLRESITRTSYVYKPATEEG